MAYIYVSANRHYVFILRVSIYIRIYPPSSQKFSFDFHSEPLAASPSHPWGGGGETLRMNISGGRRYKQRFPFFIHILKVVRKLLLLYMCLFTFFKF